LGVGFSVPKTELIHWRTNRDRDPISNAPIHLDRSVFTPKGEVRWLGYWFTPSISTTPHFVKRLAKAQAAFVAVKRLSPPGIGLPPLLCHRLASSLLFTHHQLRRRLLSANGPHDQEAIRVLAQGPAMDDKLLRKHPHRHPGHRGLPPTARAPPHI